MTGVVEAYLGLYPGERERVALVRQFLEKTGDRAQWFHRKNFEGHITAGGFVLSPDRRKLALVRHLTLHRHLQPGGHVEASDAGLVASARREILEETGLEDCRHLPVHADPSIPFDIDSHWIPPNPNKGEPGHYHHDFRFLFQAAAESDPGAFSRPGESTWEWRPIPNAIADASFRIVTAKLAGLAK